MAEGIMSLSRGAWLRGAMLWGMLLSSALLVGALVEWIGGRVFAVAWERAAAGGRPAHAPSLLPRLSRAMSFLPGATRGVAMKDIRTFLRDPMQWSQALVFFGLLSLYFANLRTFRYHALPDVWRNAISLLNVFSVSAVICSLGSRFVYPQLSLEGQSFWIIGLCPARISRVLLTKFAMAAIGMLAVTVSLTFLSGSMLRIAWHARLAALALSAAVTLAVCALSTGLGAIFLDLKQRNPAAIVSGFGGTLNLVISLGFMLAAILPFGLVFHWKLGGAFTPAGFRLALAAVSAWLVALTALATVLPLWLAARSLERREF
jgi:ABC-2 type transport system permease protein